jgi:hypothetical protein
MVWMTSKYICKTVAPLSKERDNLFAIPLENLKVNIKIHEATDSSKIL